MAYSLCLKKSNFKFSSAHFTIFSNTEAENLHGHNYQVAVYLLFSDVEKETDMTVHFHEIKNKIKTLCEEWDEKILIANKSNFLSIHVSLHYKDHLEVHFAKRRYCFPKNEVCLLDVSNVTSESLARLFYKKLRPQISCLKMRVSITETSGQSASYTEDTLEPAQ